MSELRWILLAAALLVIAYVYWRGRADQRRGERTGAARRIEPVVRAADLTVDSTVVERREPALGVIDEVVDDDAIPAAAQPAAWPADAATQRGRAARAEHAEEREPQESARGSLHASGQDRATDAAANKIVALRIVRRSGERIPGTLLLDVLHREGLQFGEHRIFHRYAEADNRVRAPLFSIANMAEPGELDPDQIEDLDLAGVAVFMVLPGPKAGASALTDMLGTARRVAAGLSAELLDSRGSTMTRQTADHMRDEIVEFEHRHRSDHQAGAPADR